MAGVAAAHRLATKLGDAAVTVLEAAPEVGGQLRTTTTPDGRVVELGAEWLPLDDPGVVDLLQQHPDLVAQHPSSAPVLVQSHAGTLVSLPAGLSIGGPLRLGPLARSGLLSPAGLIRAAAERVMKHRPTPEDISLGGFAQLRFGAQVVERITDPLAGNDHAANVFALGMDDLAPEFDEVRATGASVLATAAAPGTERTAGPREWPGQIGTLPGGNVRLLARMLEHPRIKLLRNAEVTGITPEDEGWLVHTAFGLRPCDAVIVATGGQVADELVGEFSPVLHDALAWTRTASTATVVAGIDPAQAQASPVLQKAAGVRLPRSSTRVLHQVSNLSVRWPHLAAGADCVVRLDAGRSTDLAATQGTDQELTDRLFAELSTLLGTTITPRWSMVHRDLAARPQIGTAHGVRMAAARAELAAQHPGLEVAGEFIDGPGVGRAVRSGQAAADRVISQLA